MEPAMTVLIDLTEQSASEIEMRLDMLERQLAESRERDHRPRCPQCHHWVPAGALICWHCRQLLEIRPA